MGVKKQIVGRKRGTSGCSEQRPTLIFTIALIVLSNFVKHDSNCLESNIIIYEFVIILDIQNLAMNNCSNLVSE